jgi:2-phospho-L-lactate guanylyltransferase (CobY/MobA/RfbA family)
VKRVVVLLLSPTVQFDDVLVVQFCQTAYFLNEMRVVGGQFKEFDSHLLVLDLNDRYDLTSLFIHRPF